MQINNGRPQPRTVIACPAAPDRRCPLPLPAAHVARCSIAGDAVGRVPHHWPHGAHRPRHASSAHVVPSLPAQPESAPMRIADLCTRVLVSTQVTVSVRDAAEAMRQHHVGALVVVEKPNGERIPVGIVTDRDIVVAVVATGGNPDKLTLGQIMSRPVVTCTESEGLFAAILTMREHGVRRLPVFNAKGGLAGMVSADDIYGALGAQMVDLGEALTREETREMQQDRKSTRLNSSHMSI